MRSSYFAGILIAMVMTLSGAGAAAQSMTITASATVDRCAATCPDGHEYRKCGEDGEPIYYFADPCLMHSAASSSSRMSCNAVCPDGYRYRTCTDNGYPIEYATDPCMNRSSSSSSSSSSVPSCGPHTLHCLRNMMPVCRDNVWICTATVSSSSLSTIPVCRNNRNIRCRLGLYPVCAAGAWVCRASSSSSSISAGPSILTVSPSYGIIGSTVTITGRGFARRGNTVHFADSTFPNVASRDGGHLQFRIPDQSVHQCVTGAVCPLYLRVYTPATYEVSVTANGKTSEAVPFTIVSD